MIKHTYARLQTTNASPQIPRGELASAMADQATQVHLYSVDFPDPFPGALNGSTSHSFGIPLIFYLPPGRIYPQFSAVLNRFSVALLDHLMARSHSPH
jgi:hypothetical protein